jgi:hypothetical protein
MAAAAREMRLFGSCRGDGKRSSPHDGGSQTSCHPATHSGIGAFPGPAQEKAAQASMGPGADPKSCRRPASGRGPARRADPKPDCSSLREVAEAARHARCGNSTAAIFRAASSRHFGRGPRRQLDRMIWRHLAGIGETWRGLAKYGGSASSATLTLVIPAQQAWDCHAHHHT